MNSTGGRLRDPDQREVRGARILDVTADLLQRHGYRRVTIEDIARHAQIGKGTVYLHWKTHDDLVRAVFEREVLRAIDELLESLRQDPKGWVLHRLAQAYFLAIMRRPLLTGLFLDDAELLGKLARPDSGTHEQRHDLMSRAYFELLAKYGVLRDGLSADEGAYAFVATLEGFIRAEAAGGEQPGSGVDDRATLLALTVQGAFETGRKLSRAAEKAASGRVIELFASLAEADRASTTSTTRR
jgi:AcrR family transcriptional regulator